MSGFAVQWRRRRAGWLLGLWVLGTAACGCGRPVSWTQPGASPFNPPFLGFHGIASLQAANDQAVKRGQQVAPDDPLSLRHMPKRVGPEVHVQAARLFESQGKWDRAIQSYQDALKTDSRYEPALLGLARLYDRRGHFAEAERWYRRAAELNPTSAAAKNDWAMCVARQGRLADAIPLWRQAAHLAPDEPLYRNNLARALVQSGRYDEAYAELAAVFPPAAAHYNLAFFFLEIGQRQLARRALDNSLTIDPAFGRARNLLAKLDATNAASPQLTAAPADASWAPHVPPLGLPAGGASRVASEAHITASGSPPITGPAEAPGMR
ncbi:MAG: hypothetical protein KatS3mg110_1229 [Pirellulaceae bacterium]|nr:MAG: hypothetical protein KatS3mg110_1229 [Pirellulaceae bacterium]